jgi:parallel beta-helix repeat protein
LYSTGIKITSSNNIIDNCIFQNTPIGIAIFSSNNTISNTTFKNCSDEGILLVTTEIMKCYYNIIENCTFYNNCDAIELQKSSYNIIQNCKITDNTHSGIDAIKQDNNHNIINNCIISNNSVHGIYFSKSINNSINKCQIFSNIDGNIVDTNKLSENNITQINNFFYNEKLNNFFQGNNKLITLISNIISNIINIIQRLTNNIN